MNKEFLTIKEFADLKGVSVSSVYKRLNTTLKPFLSEVEGKKVLNIKVLEKEGLKPLNREVEEVSTSTPQPSSTPSPSSSSVPSSSFLERQIDEKDKQIENLNNQLKELQESIKKKDDFIQEQSRKLTELLEQSNILLQNNQLLLSDKTGEVKKEVNVYEDVETRAVVKEDEEEQPQPEKISWFKRLFR